MRTLRAAVDSVVVTTETPAAVLWDMDGTLVDTEPYWMVAERELVLEHGGVWSAADGLALVGQGLEHSAASLQSRGVTLSVAEIIDQLTHRVLEQATVDIPWRPGARELLIAVKQAGIRTALVTMSMRPLAEHVSGALGEPLFDVIVTGGDVEHPKPHPDPYERAAVLLDVNIADCVALEDSAPGLASATAAGAVTIGIPAHVELAEDPRYTLWPTLKGRTLDDLVSEFQSRRQQPGRHREFA